VSQLSKFRRGRRQSTVLIPTNKIQKWSQTEGRERAGGVTRVLELFTTPFPGLSNTDLFLIQIFFK
jgi:hypothetical protein